MPATVYYESDADQGLIRSRKVAVLGYGSQGHGQGLNARDNGLNVIVGVRKDGESWKQAIGDGWVGHVTPG